MDGVAGCPQIVGKRQEPGRLPLRMMEQEYRRHHGTVASLRPAANAAHGASGKPRGAQQASHAWSTSPFLISVHRA
jgi:hypothetical protein